jgi:hypothetical protein
VDPDGLLAFFWHFGITAVVAWNSGYGLVDSLILAWDTMAVDFGESASDPVRHGMALPGQSRVEALASTHDYIKESKCSDPAGGIHATQDLDTPGHDGKEWLGYKVDDLVQIQGTIETDRRESGREAARKSGGG